MAQETGTRPEVLLFVGESQITTSVANPTAYSSLSADNTTVTPLVTFVGANEDFSKFYVNESESEKVFDSTLFGSADLYKYVRIFFENGGVRLTLVKGKVSDLTKDVVKKEIGQEPIILAELGFDSSELENVVTKLDEFKGVYQKLFVYRKPFETSADDTSTDNTLAFKESEKSSFVICKLSNLVGSEMSIAAYLSHIRVYENGSIADYDFTEEYGLEEDLSTDITYGEEDISLADIPYNFEMKVAGKYINVGGNSTDGEDLVEQYIIIILQQTVSEVTMNTLTAKLVGQQGTNALYSAVSAELYRYVNSGFLVTDKIWTKPTLSVPNLADTSKSAEVVIEKNTPMLSGFAIHVFSLSQDRRSAYIYIILPTAKGIRYVQIDGKAI